MKSNPLRFSKIALIGIGFLTCTAGLTRAQADDVSQDTQAVRDDTRRDQEQKKDIRQDERKENGDRKALRNERAERNADASRVSQDNSQINRDVQAGNLGAAKSDEAKRAKDTQALKQEQKDVNHDRGQVHRDDRRHRGRRLRSATGHCVRVQR